MTLTELQLKRIKPKGKDYKLYDEKGLYLLVKASGATYWRFKYRFGGKEKTLALGVYSEVSLAEARDGRAAARTILRNGGDPSLERKKNKLKSKISTENTFKAIAQEWLDRKSRNWSVKHSAKVSRSLERDVFPYIGNLPIDQIETILLRSVFDTIENRGALEHAGRLRQRCSSVFQYAMAIGACDVDPALPLRSVMESPKKEHYPALAEKEMPEFLAKIRTYNCHPQSRLAIELLMITFVRTSELIGARWEEFDFEEKMWDIPPERMKKDRPHFVPLAHQTIELLNQLRSITGKSELLFPKRGSMREPMSNSTILRIIIRIGYRGRMTGHGFRSVASTILNESGMFDFDAIERQLSHEDENDIRAAYNRARYMGERRNIMQWWADRVDRFARPNIVIYPGTIRKDDSLTL